MKVISRNWINEEAHFYVKNRGFTRKYFFSIIDYWKSILLQHEAKPGDKIGFAVATVDISYVAAIFAAFELGLKLTILLKPVNEKEMNSPKFNVFYPLDILILDRLAIRWFPELKDYYTSNSRHVIDLIWIGNTFQPIKKPSKKIKNIYPAENDTCLLCTSSGSTGQPKIVNHTHKFFYDLCSFNWEPLEFKEEDKVLHLVSFNHGSALGIYFLPSLRTCKWHYFSIPDFSLTLFDDENWDRFVLFCQKAGITKMQCPFDFSIDYMINAFERSETGCPDLTIYILTFINPKWYELVKKGKIKKVISIFGCSETSGPLFLPYVDKDTENFSPNFLGYPIKGFHEISIVDNSLHVTIPTYGTTINTEDSLKDMGNGYDFAGKKKLYRIHDTEINVYDIQGIFLSHVTGFHYKDAIILVDEIYNRLYAVTNNKEIVKHVDDIKESIRVHYNDKIELEELFYIEDMSNFVTGIKPDREKLLNYVRQVRNEQY